MFNGAVVAAVVPAYKEEAMIATVIETMPEFVDHIVIVDDCSPDRTSEVVNEIASPRVTLIRHEVNQGVGGAIITGHRAAMDLGADVNVVMAGDAQMDPAHLPALYRMSHINTGITLFEHRGEHLIEGIDFDGWSLLTWNDRAHL